MRHDHCDHEQIVQLRQREERRIEKGNNEEPGTTDGESERLQPGQEGFHAC
jgi:hypothetical protein